MKEDPTHWSTTTGSQPRMSARSLYAYVWKTSRTQQIIVCVLTMVISPLPMAYLELQRRIVDDALPEHNLNLLALLGVIYFGVISVKSALKYALNMTKGVAVENVARDIRQAHSHQGGDPRKRAAIRLMSPVPPWFPCFRPKPKT